MEFLKRTNYKVKEQQYRELVRQRDNNLDSDGEEDLVEYNILEAKKQQILNEVRIKSILRQSKKAKA